MEIDPPPSLPVVPSSLADLVGDIREARENLRVMRVAPVVQADLLSARQTLLRALEAYVDVLIARRLPVPRQLRDELRLQRGIRRHPDDSGWHRGGRPSAP